jgi:hypothetical protein
VLCERFGIGWTEYGQLTRREQRVLVELLNREAADAKKPDRSGMERIV